MLSLSLIPLIDVTFSTPTGHFTQISIAFGSGRIRSIRQ